MKRVESAPQLGNSTVRRDELKPGHEWVEDTDRKWCKLCARKFNVFRRRHHCRMCGDVFCDSCTTFVTIVVREENKNSVRICGACISSHKAKYSIRCGPSTSLQDTTLLERATKSVSVPSAAASIAVSAPGHRHHPRHLYAAQDAPRIRQRKSNSVHQISSSGLLVDDLLPSSPSTWRMFELVTASSFPETSPWSYAWPCPPTTTFESQRLGSVRDSLAKMMHRMPDNLCDLLCKGYDCPMSAVSVIDATTQHFVSRVGIAQDSLARHLSLCAHTICGLDPFVVLDLAADPRFHHHPLVTEANIRYYAAAPLVADDGMVVGTVCVMDTKPRKSCFDACLTSIARMAARHLKDTPRMTTDVTPRQVENILVNLLSKTNDIHNQLLRRPPLKTTST
ncbi:hypothetical protein DYB38_008472 [Aphanomyces astaci]|uniref:FYVE-type domain-containing protein n=1 Tax=Aphanomyces astaci TaxID=112090 RepID=A0A397DPD8_APHAT|nr:hypothetical protein DYB36_001406 [Aphanomyces astaci]RHY38225.1 hypothetical protein DYB34_001112 [Aphanomyces astaci]RHY67923.1 hypothetical protein DYB38_008472 [Aphanomyces astaci]RHZ38696.1 hypothetical protein DYB31_009645 [Aphanomyces astaci]